MSFSAVLRKERWSWLDAEVLFGSNANVTSAIELTAEERKREQYLLPYLGEQMEVAYHIDPSILGGLVVRVGDHVVDGSVAGKLRELQHELS
jgi:F0F1-type ATP synthase delta subunit